MQCRPWQSILALLVVACGNSRAADASFFALTMTAANVDMAATFNPNAAIQLEYSFQGPMSSEDSKSIFTFIPLEYDCVTTTNDIYMHSYLEDKENDLVKPNFGIEFDTISSSPHWTSTGNATATMKFCVRFEVRYDGVLTSVHESKLTTQVNLLQGGGGFDTGSVDLDLVQSQEVAHTAQVTVDYPLTVFCCNHNAIQTACPTYSNQGVPIQICVQLASQNPGVFVSDIYNLKYSSEAYYPGTIVTAVNNGIINDLVTENDCKQQSGVCRLHFIPLAGLFPDVSQNALIVEGEAIVGFGSDRRLSSDVEAVAKFAVRLPMIGVLVPNRSTRRFPLMMIAFGAVVAVWFLCMGSMCVSPCVEKLEPRRSEKRSTSLRIKPVTMSAKTTSAERKSSPRASAKPKPRLVACESILAGPFCSGEDDFLDEILSNVDLHEDGAALGATEGAADGTVLGVAEGVARRGC